MAGTVPLSSCPHHSCRQQRCACHRPQGGQMMTILLSPLGRKLEAYHCVRVGYVLILRVTRLYRLGMGVTQCVTVCACVCVRACVCACVCVSVCVCALFKGTSPALSSLPGTSSSSSSCSLLASSSPSFACRSPLCRGVLRSSNCSDSGGCNLPMHTQSSTNLEQESKAQHKWGWSEVVLSPSHHEAPCLQVLARRGRLRDLAALHPPGAGGDVGLPCTAVADGHGPGLLQSARGDWSACRVLDDDTGGTVHIRMDIQITWMGWWVGLREITRSVNSSLPSLRCFLTTCSFCCRSRPPMMR